jgi:hypothetical protein
LFASLAGECEAIDRFSERLDQLRQQAAAVRRTLAAPDDSLGHRR